MPEVLTLREIDAVIAELLHESFCQCGNDMRPNWRCLICHKLGSPLYTTDPAASYALRQKMREMGWLHAVRILDRRRACAQFWLRGSDPHTTKDQGDAISPTEMLAVALACCAALGRPVEVKP